MQPGTHKYIIAALFIITGLLHFIRPKPFIHIIPGFIPFHRAMVYISGVAELLGAIGLLIPKTQQWAGWGLILLLIAVFPANIKMAVDAFQSQGWSSFYFMVTLIRLPLQFVLIYWIYWACIQ